MNGPPWNTRIAVRVHSDVPGPVGQPGQYDNRAILLLEVVWGRLMRWEDDEDTERVASWDRRQSTERNIPV